MVVEAVCCELVSGVIFPVYREFTGNSCESPGFPTELAPDSGTLSSAWRQIPCAQEQGINPPHQGSFWTLQGTCGAKQGESQRANMNGGINLECDCRCTGPNHSCGIRQLHLANKAGTHQIALQCDGCRTASAVKALAVPLLECRAMTTR